MAKVNVKGKITKQGRDLLKDPYKREEYLVFNKTIISFMNPSLTLDEFEIHYTAKKVLDYNKSENPKTITGIFEQLSAAIILNVGTGIELLSKVGISLEKISKLSWNSTLLNRVWATIFNQNPNYMINGVKRCIWLESIDTQIIDGSTSMEDYGILISELRGFEEKLIERKVDEKLLISWNAMMTGLEVILNEYMEYHIELTKKQIQNQKSFIEKVFSSIGYYKWWILGYTALAGSVYLGLSAFGVPVAGEVFTPEDAIKATVVDASMYTAAMGVAGAVLL